MPAAAGPRDVATLLGQGLALHQQGQLARAKAIYAQVLATQPKNFDALHLSGAAAGQAGDFAEALANYEKAIAIQPDHAEVHFRRGHALRALKRAEDAVASYDRALAIRPDYAEAWSSRGNAFKEMGRLEEALASYDRALAIKPQYAGAWSNRGVALQELDRAEEALASCDRALALAPGHAEAHSNRGNALKALNRLDEALASFDNALALKPGYVHAAWNKALALLALGRFEQGWAWYESRWNNEDTGLALRSYPQPRWLGRESLAGKTILLYAEQGLGDTIQFCRYARLVQAQGARVVLEVPAALVPLLQGLAGVDQLLAEGSPLPAFDCQSPLLSLPLAFDTRLDSIPAPVPYLTSSAAKRGAWASRLGQKTRPRIGLAWSGRTTHKNDRNRSITLGELAAQLPDDFDYISLQKDLREADQASLPASGIRHFAHQLRDFTDTAALCDLVDLVITVDTSVAHLAGAMGRQTRVLLPLVPDWRWMTGRNDSPWYPTVRLVRQQAPGDWAGTLSRALAQPPG
ncbi:MAG: glycosyltransferase family protein [Burkholderiales bacterium]|nr:glycosyltransferase family protein [Burkholderiales bacterium]